MFFFLKVLRPLLPHEGEFFFLVRSVMYVFVEISLLKTESLRAKQQGKPGDSIMCV